MWEGDGGVCVWAMSVVRSAEESGAADVGRCGEVMCCAVVCVWERISSVQRGRRRW